jgi:hypothetical protein
MIKIMLALPIVIDRIGVDQRGPSLDCAKCVIQHPRT